MYIVKAKRVLDCQSSKPYILYFFLQNVTCDLRRVRDHSFGMLNLQYDYDYE